jgi:hypothetical protein
MHFFIVTSCQKYFDDRKEELLDELAHKRSSTKLGSVCSNSMQLARTTKRLHGNKKYASNSKEQLEFEYDIIALTTRAYTPLSLVEHEAFRNLIRKRDPTLNMISRTQLSQNLISKKSAEIIKNVQHTLTHIPAVSLSFNYLMTRRAEEVLSLEVHYVTGITKAQTHLGMTWSKGGTDGQSLSMAIKSCIDKFHLRQKVICYTLDGRDNLKMFKDNLDEAVSNDAIFNPSKPIFEQSCLAHALSGACKKAVISTHTQRLTIEQTQQKMQKFIIWTKESQKGCDSWREAQEFCHLPPQKLLTPVKTRFAYLMYSIRSLIANQAAIDYLYGQKEGRSAQLCKRLPLNEDWEIARCLVETMKHIVGSFPVNQANGSKRLLSEAIVNFIHVSLQCSCSAGIPLVEERLQELLHEGSRSSDAQNLVINLKELYQNQGM